MSQNTGSSSTAAGMREDMRELKGEAAASAERLAEDAREELARLRAQVEKLMQERVTPALAGAAETVEDYAARARDRIERQADALSSTVRERPLLAVGVAALAGFLIGRLTGGTTYVYSSDRR
ncbi:hypothetical protein GCM10010964_00520 [Caldovatus sediminis]|jgi:ElaB/YqjD/DUF883 family membrane-anchored ribosome-binding protein|uniref:DUF883 domain-containing protein n=1 Tax=Caldovatus sediminis TaxID=2041189 RepID=A0A8J3EBR5_9PROT|nr:hypothetical protein [Caldovatus sediminis]GGG16130.1 hypothetical protein GCM10010964_00520 [Caldovatus sediminis]